VLRREPLMQALRQLRAYAARLCAWCNFESPGIQPLDERLLAKKCRQALFAKKLRQLPLHGIANIKAISGPETVQHQFFNMQLHDGRSTG
jgi:hypothetical protein